MNGIEEAVTRAARQDASLAEICGRDACEALQVLNVPLLHKLPGDPLQAEWEHHSKTLKLFFSVETVAERRTLSAQIREVLGDAVILQEGDATSVRSTGDFNRTGQEAWITKAQLDSERKLEVRIRCSEISPQCHVVEEEKTVVVKRIVCDNGGSETDAEVGAEAQA